MRSLRHQLWLGFGGMLLILLAVSVLSVVVLTRYSKALERVFREKYDSAVYCDAMKSSLERLNLRAQFLIWDEPSAAAIDAAAEENRFDENLGHQFNNCTLPGEAEHTQQLARLWVNYKEGYSRFERSDADGRRNLYRSDLLPRHQEIEQTAQWIADSNMSNMVSVDGQVKRALLDVRNAVVVLVITGTAAAVLVVGATGASILRALGALTASARQIEAGNLDLRLEVRDRDEFGQLADAFNSMTAKLREFRRRDHDRLARTQQTTQLAIDSLPDAVFIIGPGGDVEISNLSAGTHFGIEPGMNVQALGARLKWLGPLYEAVKEGRQSPEQQGYRSAVQLFDAGRELYLLPRAVPILVADGRPVGVCFILVDVTRLRAADEAKSNLVSMVSHELRTPLTSIRMSLGLLGGKKFGAITSQQEVLLKAAREDSERLYRIIENVLSISRMESGRAQFQFQPTRPSQIVNQALDPMRSAFAERRICLTDNVTDDLPLVQADPTAIGSALTNLLSNALKFTPAGGEVTVSAAATDGMVSFTVSDSGPGIPAQYGARIFDKFFRIPRPEGPTGAGLGLAIAKEVVEAHGGVIELCAAGGAGSSFRFTLLKSDGAARDATAAGG